ncbi:MAG: endolytic transglycosylase MltG [Candidatus Muirbacterium halophilum]|nr:endolytic transglycosylase MltG [Candidatus Muirbacterium halophilum]MCK9475335.1 endolytic transglycosylase MltG [Candidatus Muirbacterium halophilum]
MKLKNKLFLLLLVLILIPIIFFYTIFFVEREYNISSEIIKGDSVIKVIKKTKIGNFEELGLKLLFRFNNTSGKILPKKFEIKGKFDLFEIHDILISPGKQSYISFTILPGERWKEVRENIINFSGGQDPDDYYYIYSRKYKFLNEIGSFEGFIAPDTYYINKDSQNIVMELLELGLNKFNNDYYDKYKDESIQGLDFYNLCILSSIVEKEGRFEEENKIIAGVFLNRLKKNQALESCATIQYILEKPKKRLYYKDTAISSLYNTYLNKGLPPGPICFFTNKTFKSVLNYKKHDYYYFVLKDNGKHHFSKTLEEHNRNK